MQCSKINTHSRKCMFLLECPTDHLVPESSPTLSHSPMPRMRIIIFICLWTTLRCVYIYIYISIRPSPTIDIIYGLPSDVYQLGCLRRLIFLVWTTLRSFLVLDNPPKPFSLDSSHALTPTVLGCPSAYEMHDFNSITVYNTCKYINMNIFT